MLVSVDSSEVMIITQQAKLIRLGVDKIRETDVPPQGVMLFAVVMMIRQAHASYLQRMTKLKNR